ncbi:MAG: hypothetical protein ABEI86_14005 [Halobacteriaceae archaeon]
MDRRQLLTTAFLAGLPGCSAIGSRGADDPGFIEQLTIANFDEEAPHTLEVIILRNSDRQVVFWRRLELERSTDNEATGSVYEQPVKSPGSYTVIARMDGATTNDQEGVLHAPVTDRCEQVMVVSDFSGTLDIAGGRCESAVDSPTETT